jgi:intracellular sulfur oxidation DsrE/DsrF family protein
MEQNEKNPRREFLGKLTTGAVAGFAALTTSFTATADTEESVSNADEWFKKLTGKHRIVFDVTQPHEIFPFAWPRVFLITNGATGTPEKECGVVVVLRHDAIGYAMEDRLWEKYKFGEVFKAKDPATGAAATRNPFAKPKPGDFKAPGLGQIAIGINELQNSGVMFCVCDVALTVYSAAVAQGANLDAAEVKKDWVAGLLPGIQSVPSGVWAVGRAQEHGCSYCFAG